MGSLVCVVSWVGKLCYKVIEFSELCNSIIGVCVLGELFYMLVYKVLFLVLIFVFCCLDMFVFLFGY